MAQAAGHLSVAPVLEVVVKGARPGNQAISPLVSGEKGSMRLKENAMGFNMSLDLPEPEPPALTRKQFERAIKVARENLEKAGNELVEAETEGLLTVDEIDGKPVKLIGWGIPTGRFYAAQARLQHATGHFAYVMQLPIKPEPKPKRSRWVEYAKHLASTPPEEE